MNTLITIFLFTVIGLVTWFVAESQERKRATGALREIESKWRSAEGKAIGFQAELSKWREEAATLQKSLDLERERKNLAKEHWNAHFYKGIVLSAVAALFVGGLSSGFISGVYTSHKVESKFRQKLVEMDVMTRVAEMNADTFKNQIEKMEKEIAKLRKMLDDERVGKTIAETKLEIILENLTEEKWGRGFVLDPFRIKKHWDHSAKEQTSAAASEIPSPRVAPF